MKLKTERLVLRPVTPKDVDDIYEYSRDPDVGPNAGWKPHEDVDETLDIMHNVFLGKDDTFAIVLRETKKLIGTIGLVDDPKRTYSGSRAIGYAIGKPYWGKGLMAEAVTEMLRYGFDDLGLKLVTAYCYPHNNRSQRVLVKNGFTLEGNLRKCTVLFDGTVLDELCYSILREEFYNRWWRGNL